MLAKKYRFHGHRSLNLTLTHGKLVRNNYLRIKYLKNQRRQKVRWAVVVSRKVDKKAVVRNRIRRRLYETVRRQWVDFDQGLDLIIIVNDRQIAEIAAVDLEEMVKSLLLQIGQKT